MKSWTRTLNLDDAHSLLALAEVGMAAAAWTTACHAALPELSLGRRRELIRILRDNFLDWQDGKLTAGLFLTLYQRAPAPAQMQVLELHWALTHPLTLIATETLIGPAIDHNEPNVPLSDVEALVSAHIETSSVESLRKTRTVLLGALEGVGTLVAKGTGANRSSKPQETFFVSEFLLLQQTLKTPPSSTKARS